LQTSSAVFIKHNVDNAFIRIPFIHGTPKGQTFAASHINMELGEGASVHAGFHRKTSAATGHDVQVHHRFTRQKYKEVAKLNTGGGLERAAYSAR
jgi:hypothetical protein